MATFREDIKIQDKGLTVGANEAPDASAVMDLQSTTKGMLSPRMTTAQREAISSPAEGLEVFDTDLNCKFQYTGSAWEKLSTKTELDAHINSSTAHTAANIVNVPSGDLAATTVQAALDELQTDVNTRATSAALSSHTGASTDVHGVTGSVVGTEGAQTLKEKTLEKPKIAQYLEMIQTTTPATPASGVVLIYTKADGKVYKLDSTGVESEIGSGGGGSAGKNYLQDWFSSTKALGTVETLTTTGDRTTGQDNWGKSSAGTFAANTSSPVRGTQDYKFTPTGAGDFIESPMYTLDDADRGKILDANATVNNAGVAGDYKMEVIRYNSSGTYQEALTVYLPFASNSVPTGIMASPGYFFAGSTDTDKYSLRFTRVTSGTTAIQITDVFLGKAANALPNGAAISDWQAQTLTASNIRSTTGWTIGATTTAPTFGTTSGTMVWQKQVGDSLKCRIQFKQTSAGSAGSGLYLFKLPAGLTIDSTKTKTDTSISWGGPKVGIFSAKGSSSSAFGNVHVYDNESLALRFAQFTTTTWDGEGSISAASTTWSLSNSPMEYYLDFEIPIVGWSSNINMVPVSIQSPDKAGFIQPYAGSTAPHGWMICDGSEVSQTTYRSLFNNIGTNWNTCAKQDGIGGNWSAPSAGNFRIPDLRGLFLRGVGTSSNSSGANDITVTLGGFTNDTVQKHSHTMYGELGDTSTGSTDVVEIKKAATGVSNQYMVRSINGAESPSAIGDETAPRYTGVNYLIKLYDDVGNLAVPLQGPILADTSGNGVPERYVGEVREGSITGGSFTNNVTKDVGTLPLPKGRWQVFGKVASSASSPTGWTYSRSSLSLTATTENNDTLCSVAGASASADMMVASFPLIVDSDGTKTVYLNAANSFTGGTISVGTTRSAFYAVRIA